MSNNSSYDKMESLYQKYGGMEIETTKYKGVVCGFTYKVNDDYLERYIIAVIEEEIIGEGFTICSVGTFM